MLDFTGKIEQIGQQLAAYRQGGLRVFATSSFQSNSVVLLHVMQP